MGRFVAMYATTSGIRFDDFVMLRDAFALMRQLGIGVNTNCISRP